MKVKSKILFFLAKINFNNLDKFFKEFDKGMSVFNNGIDNLLQGLSSDVKESNTRSKDRERQNKKHLASIWGSKSNTKIWSN